jgi:peptidoglycan/LPS O-acetylase OafA/YrhL
VFGIYRYGLAFCVAISHLWAGMIGGPAAYAVWGFYCLSGYLMTLILNEKYGFSPRGLVNFAVNRVLRIYPAYYVICAGMFMLFYFIPETAAKFLPNLQMPRTPQGWRYSLFLFPAHDGNELLHGSLALRVELWFYVAIALGLGRSRRIAWAWFLTSALYTIWLLATGTPFPQRYVYIPACSLAFSTGCLIYHVRDWIPVIKTPWAALSAACLWWLHVWLTQNIPGGPLYIGLYSSLLFSAFAMATLIRLDPKELPAWMGRLDRFAGNLSYPMYLCHWGVGIMVIWLFPGKTRMDSSVFLIGFPAVNLISYLVYQRVERPLQSWKLPSLVRPGRQEGSLRPPAVAPGLLHSAHPLTQPSTTTISSGQSIPNGQGRREQVDV